MKKLLQTLQLIFAVMAVMLTVGIVTAKPVEAAAASYQRVTFGDNYKEKVGDYWFKYAWEGDEAVISISKKKNSGYKKTPMSSGLVTNGKDAYYVKDRTLCKYTLKTGKQVSLKSLKSYTKYNSDYDEYPSMTVSAVAYGNVYLTRSSFAEWNYKTYTYNLTTGKVKKVRNNCDIVDFQGSCAISQDEYRSDVSPYSITLLKLTKSGLTKIKCLTKNGSAPTLDAGYVFYVDYPATHTDEDGYTFTTMKKAVVYRVDQNGKNKKKMATFTDTSDNAYGDVSVYNITAKQCTVYINGQSYIYTYSTKKYKAI